MAGKWAERSPNLAVDFEYSPPVKQRPRLDYLDGLRGLAATYVVIFHAVGFHAGEFDTLGKVLRKPWLFGHEAVAVFIVLSGYCLMLPIARSDDQRMQRSFGTYLRRRAQRILPPYFVVLFASIAAIAFIPLMNERTGTTWDESFPGITWGPITSHVLLVHNWMPEYATQINGPLWSVASEWQIYFLLPLLVWVRRQWGIAELLSCAAVIGYLPAVFFPEAAGAANSWYVLLFAMGMAAADINFSSDALSQRLARWNWTRVASLLWLGFVVLGVGLARYWFRSKLLSDPYMGVATAALLITLGSQSHASSRLRRLLDSRPSQLIGRFSYSLYLSHLPVLAATYALSRGLHLDPASNLLFMSSVGLLAAYGVAHLLYITVEQRFLNAR